MATEFWIVSDAEPSEALVPADYSMVIKAGTKVESVADEAAGEESEAQS